MLRFSGLYGRFFFVVFLKFSFINCVLLRGLGEGGTSGLAARRDAASTQLKPTDETTTPKTDPTSYESPAAQFPPVPPTSRPLCLPAPCHPEPGEVRS